MLGHGYNLKYINAMKFLALNWETMWFAAIRYGSVQGGRKYQIYPKRLSVRENRLKINISKASKRAWEQIIIKISQASKCAWVRIQTNKSQASKRFDAFFAPMICYPKFDFLSITPSFLKRCHFLVHHYIYVIISIFLDLVYLETLKIRYYQA